MIIAVVSFVALGVWGYGKVKDRVALDPVKVTAMANQIVQLDIGPDWTPQFAMDIFIMQMAAFGSDGDQAFLIIMDGDPATLGKGESFEQKMRAEISKQKAQQGKQREVTREISSSRQDFLIRGTPTSFLVAFSEGVDSKSRFIEVSGSLESNNAGRTAFIYLMAPESLISLEQAKALIETAK